MEEEDLNHRHQHNSNQILRRQRNHSLRLFSILVLPDQRLAAGSRIWRKHQDKRCVKINSSSRFRQDQIEEHQHHQIMIKMDKEIIIIATVIITVQIHLNENW